MADIRFEFTDTDNNKFIDWDCVWRDWTWKVFKTVSRLVALKTRVHPLGLKTVVHAVGKKTNVVEKL